jgi:hypothetical protein
MVLTIARRGSPLVARRALSTVTPRQAAATKVAQTVLSGWSDANMDRPALAAASLPEMPSLAAVFDAHEALSENGAVGGLKLGWKDHPLLAAEGLPGMYCPIFRKNFIPSTGAVPVGRLKAFCAEAEFGFELEEAFPPRDGPYSAAEVWAGVRHVELVIEVCGTRIADPTLATPLQLLADGMLNAAVVRGPVVLRRGANLSASRGWVNRSDGGGGCAGGAPLGDAEALARAKARRACHSTAQHVRAQRVACGMSHYATPRNA